jgi:molybdopterin-guanine dinucleotide biosynthesis protein A
MGRPKAMLPFGSETMLQRVVRLLGSVITPIVVVAGRSQAVPMLPGYARIARDERDERGPLEGLRAGLKALPPTAEAAYVTSCDVPLLVPAFVRHMIDLLGDHDIAVVEVNGLPHPLSAVYRRSLLPHVEALLAGNRLRPALLFDAVRTRRVTPAEVAALDPDLLTLRNVNTPEEYDEALKLAAATPSGRPRPDIRARSGGSSTE